jgi:hypothetical protein
VELNRQADTIKLVKDTHLGDVMFVSPGGTNATIDVLSTANIQFKVKKPTTSTAAVAKVRYCWGDTVLATINNAVNGTYNFTWDLDAAGPVYDEAITVTAYLLDSSNRVVGAAKRHLRVTDALPKPAILTWAEGHGLTGADALPTADPDKDLRSNLEEFAFDGDPTTGNDPVKQKTSMQSLPEGDVFSMTLPIRNTASFSGAPELTAEVDGIIYTLRGTTDLNSLTLPVSEGVSSDSESLPALSPGYSYRTFRVSAEQGEAFILTFLSESEE